MAKQLRQESLGEFPVDGPPSDAIGCFFLGESTTIARGCYGCPALTQDELKRSLFIGPSGIQLNLNDLTLMGEYDGDDHSDEVAIRQSSTRLPAISRGLREKIGAEHQRRAEAGLNGTCEFIGKIDSCWYGQVVDRMLEVDSLDQK